MVRLAPWTVVVVAWAGLARADESFPGVTKRSYHGQVANLLRHPSFDGGQLSQDGVEWTDPSVFSDGLYADLLPYARAQDRSLSFLTGGLSYRHEALCLYGFLGGALDHTDGSTSFGHLALGAAYKKKVWGPFVANLYLQLEVDTSDGFQWELGTYPLESPWVASSLHAFFKGRTPTVLEVRSRITFASLGYLSNLEARSDRYSLAVSRRTLALFAGHTESSPYELEVELALNRPRAPAPELIWEARVLTFFSTVGDGPRGEARPGVHVNVSYVTANSSGWSGLGAEVGFGAKQIDTAQSQELYFTAFYNYAGYYFRHPSLLAGVGLVGRF